MDTISLGLKCYVGIAFGRPRAQLCIIADVLDACYCYITLDGFNSLCNALRVEYLSTVQEHRRCQLEYGRVHISGSHFDVKM